jgi:hypothetical protein
MSFACIGIADSPLSAGPDHGPFGFALPRYYPKNAAPFLKNHSPDR